MAHELEVDLQHVLQNTQDVWPSLAGVNILLTGASGFVGSWLIESFLWANEQLNLKSKLYALTRDPQSLRPARPELNVLVGDLKGFRFPIRPYHYIIHVAMEHETPATSAEAAFSGNLHGVECILKTATSYGTQRILLTSSGAVYGPQPSDLPKLPEDFAGTLDEGNKYVLAKSAAEIQFAQSGIPSVIARLFAFTGPYLPLDRNFAAGNFVRDALVGGPIRIEGDGLPLRSYLYAADLAIWLWTLLIKGEPARPYNVGSDQAVSILQLAQTVERVCGAKHGISVAKTPIPGETPKRYIPLIDRARSELNLQPLIPLDEGIRRMFTWYQRRQTSTK